jgi:hypothetical protein
MLLRQPNGLTLKAYFEFQLAVLGLIDEELATGGGDGWDGVIASPSRVNESGISNRCGRPQDVGNTDSQLLCGVRRRCF